MGQVEIIKLNGHWYSHIVICGETVLGYISDSMRFLPLTGYINMSTMETITYVWNNEVKKDKVSCCEEDV
jgi:hypothetical protein